MRAESRSRERLPSAVVYGSLKDGIVVCLGLLAEEGDRFEPAAVAWHARWCASLPGVLFAESRAALCALEALMGPQPSAGALALSDVCRRHGVDDVASVLDMWLEAHSAATKQVDCS
jgi:hypothetical protein